MKSVYNPKLLIFILLLFAQGFAFASTGEPLGYTGGSDDGIGFAWQDMIIGAIIALVCVPIGGLLINLSESKDKDGNKDENGFLGCLGAILICGGGCCALPLIFSAIYVGIAIVIVGGILFLIFKFLINGKID